MAGGQSYEQAWAFVATLAGDPNTAIFDWRALHDTDKSIAGHARRGTLVEWWPWLCQMNDAGYGIFATIAMMDGAGRELANVSYIRAHYVDLDNASSEQNYQRAAQASPAPAMAVHSSVLYDGATGAKLRDKYHVYWPVQGYSGNEYFQLIQRKLKQVFDGDKSIIDATRVMRIPGTWHLKVPSRPHLVTCHALPGYGQQMPVTTLADALASVNVIDGGTGERHALGDPSLAAPDLGWIERGFTMCDPNNLDRMEWISLTCAFKQAMWSHTSPEQAFIMWSNWCSQYAANDPGENAKQWNSIRETELGWQFLRNKIPSLNAQFIFANKPDVGAVPAVAGDNPAPVPPMPVNAPPALDCSGEMLTHIEQQTWFKQSIYVVNMGEMLTLEGRFLNSGQFNVAFGGKKFIVDGDGKVTNEAWAAATRSTLWTVPQVDHTRFVPHMPFRDIIEDDLGRKGVNIYKPLKVKRVAGDVGPFLRHMAALLPNEADRKVVIEYLAHNVRFPGHKIPWMPVIQSAEGAGKGVIKAVMKHAMGKPYVHFPNAAELAASGAKFNAWLRNKLFILVDEIKTDEKQQLIEVLKPLISEEDTEVQAKGFDQELEDNFSNWMAFTNWKNAIPISKNGRRFAMFYSPLQTADDLMMMQMGEGYFNWLYGWLKEDGAAIVTDYLHNYPIAQGSIPMRAPMTSSTDAAIVQSRGPIERVIHEGIEDALPGFRGGWISATMVARRLTETKAVRGAVSPQTIGNVIEGLGYVACGRAPVAIFQEDRERPYIYHYGQAGDVNQYKALQGWPEAAM